jgi:hypothetical protein
MIISRSYFKSIVQIPNAQDTAPNSNLIGNATSLDYYIEEFERDILVDCFGYPLYSEFINELDSSTSNGLKSTANQKWDDLLNGKEYDIDGLPVKWRGLIFKDKLLDRSLIAYYVFCEFLSNNLVSFKGTGAQIEKTKNSINVTADPLYVASFRTFHKLTEFTNCTHGFRSLYDFIQDMNNVSPGTYANWHPKRFENVNILGL